MPLSESITRHRQRNLKSTLHHLRMQYRDNRLSAAAHYTTCVRYWLLADVRGTEQNWRECVTRRDERDVRFSAHAIAATKFRYKRE